MELLSAMTDLEIDGDIAAQQKSRSPSRQVTHSLTPFSLLTFLHIQRQYRNIIPLSLPPPPP